MSCNNHNKGVRAFLYYVLDCLIHSVYIVVVLVCITWDDEGNKMN